MTVTTTFPGVYIQEIPSTNHTVQPAPTADAVFIGVTNPFKKSDKVAYGEAVELLSFADYQLYFGGFFSCEPYFHDYVGHAVFQFFQNGGATAWVIALDPQSVPQAIATTNWTVAPSPGVLQTIGAEQNQPAALSAAYTAYANEVTTLTSVQRSFVIANRVGTQPPAQGPNAAAVTAAANALLIEWQNYLNAAITAGARAAATQAKKDAGTRAQGLLNQVSSVTFTALQPINDGTSALVNKGPRLSLNVVPRDSAGLAADIVITYGTQTETYRNVAAPDLSDRLSGSRLVTVNNSPSVYPVPPAPAPGAAPLTPAQLTIAPSFGYPGGSFSSARNTYESAALFQNMNVFDPPTLTGQASGVSLIPIFNLMCLPGMIGTSADQRAVQQTALACCEKNRAFLLVDPPENVVDMLGAAPGTPGAVPAIGPAVIDTTTVAEYFNESGLATSSNGAFYFPWLSFVDPVTQQVSASPPSGFVAGAIARQDAQFGVYTTAAGYQAVLKGVSSGVVRNGRMSDQEQGTLNPVAVNCIRTFSASTVIFGGRTLVGATNNSAFEQWRYISVRRFALFLEDSLYDSLSWVVFAPNARPLWSAIKVEVEAFMAGLYKNNAFAGATPKDAYQVVCDDTTTTQADIDRGIVNLLVAFAPLKPAEFVVVNIAQLAGPATTQ